jgi:uncharacterized protein (DUF2141 family)
MRLLVCCLLAGSFLAAQSPPRDVASSPTGTGTISGVVSIEAEDGSVVRSARVEISLGIGRQRTTSTDERGRYVFHQLPAGRFNISAKKSGFIAASYGAKRLGGAGVPIALAAGEQATADIKLTRGSAISGTIRGPDGQPTDGVRVQLYQMDFPQGGGERALQLRTFSNSQNGSLVTDDRGAYRIYGLKAGTYYLAAAPYSSLAGNAMSGATLEWAQRLLASPGAAAPGPPPSQAQSLAQVFFPGVTDPAAAAAITVAAGQEQSGIDVALTYVTTATISGVVLGPDGQPPSLAQLSLVQPGQPFGFRGGGGFIQPAPDGTFSTSGVLPGSYKLAGRAAPRGSVNGPADPQFGTALLPLWAMLDVTVSGRDISGLEVKMAPGTTLSGRLVFDGVTEKPPADLARISISLQAMQTSQVMSMAPAAVRANADGTFTMPGVGPGLYKLTANLAGAGVPSAVWTARSSVVGGADSLDDPFEIRSQDVAGAVITFTDHPTQLAGSLLDAGGRPVPEYFVVVFSVDRKFWVPQSRRVRSVRPSNTGRFTINGLPPGEYYVCALTDVESNRLTTPEYLEPLIPAGIKIAFEEGEKKSQDLTVAARGR